MKKKFTIFLIALGAMLLIYSILWFGILITTANAINKQYAGRDLTNFQIQNKNSYSVKFSKIQSYGFPFKIGFRILRWSEENSLNKIEFNSPIYIGYNLLTQNLFLSFDGEAYGRYKPLESGFGVKFQNIDSDWTAKLPLSLNLLKTIWKKDLFQIINFIDALEIKSANTKIFDLIDEKKLYEEDHTLMRLSFEKERYYNNIEDFLNHIPKKIHIIYSTKILKSDLKQRLIPAGLLLYRFAWPIELDLATDLYLKTDADNFKDVFNNFEIDAKFIQIISNTQEYIINLNYKKKLVNAMIHNIDFATGGEIYLKSGAVDNIIEGLLKLITQAPYFKRLLNNGNLIEELQYIIENKDKFNFSPLENRKYSLNLVTNYNSIPNKKKKFEINDFSLFSNNTGIRLTSDNEALPFTSPLSKGVLAFYNYPVIIDITGNYFYNLKKFESFSEETKEIYINGLKQFLKNISDHPESIANDISFEYEIDLGNKEKIKIGTINDSNKIIPLYYLALYKNASEKIKVGDNVIVKMQELIPDFNTKQKLLEQFMTPPFQNIDNNTWQEAIK